MNEREDIILLEIDKRFDDIYFSEKIIKDNEKLPNKIKPLLEKTNNINKEWDDENQLSSIINDCINIENSIKEIKIINENINKCNLKSNKKLIFIPEENDINNFLEIIYSFGKVCLPNFFQFKKCPINAKEKKKFSVTGEKNNIFTKTGTDCYWVGNI